MGTLRKGLGFLDLLDGSLYVLLKCFLLYSLDIRASRSLLPHALSINPVSRAIGFDETLTSCHCAVFFQTNLYHMKFEVNSYREGLQYTQDPTRGDTDVALSNGGQEQSVSHPRGWDELI
jgi:hypothetical protein